MKIGERERVPFKRHDHFIKEWEAVGRILVKGYQSVLYFPLLLSKDCLPDDNDELLEFLG